MSCFVCVTCGTQVPDSAAPPHRCPICDDERQYIGKGGQRWTTLEALRAAHANSWRHLEPDLLAIETVPAFGIGQRALLLRRPQGNILWDCIALLDEATLALLRALGGVTAIAISHPHYYTTMVEWARALGCEVWLHEADRTQVMRPDPCLRFWSGATQSLGEGVTLINAGGHFPGGTVLHWQGGADGKGLVCSGDVLTVATDRKWLSFMRSYPNFIPLSRREVEAIGRAMAPFAFERLYGHYFDRVIAADAKTVLEKSIARYIAAVEGTRGY